MLIYTVSKADLKKAYHDKPCDYSVREESSPASPVDYDLALLRIMLCNQPPTEADTAA